MMESVGCWFVEESNAGVAQADAPLDIFPSVEQSIFMELDLEGCEPWQTDVACVCETMLDFYGEEFPNMLCNLRIPKLPSCLLEPTHDGSDADCGVPGGVAEDSRVTLRKIFLTMTQEMPLARVWR